MEFNERTALKMRLEQLDQREKQIVEQFWLERSELLMRIKEIDALESQSSTIGSSLTVCSKKQSFSMLVYIKRL